jgi:hypothetical protein
VTATVCTCICLVAIAWAALPVKLLPSITTKVLHEHLVYVSPLLFQKQKCGQGYWDVEVFTCRLQGSFWEVCVCVLEMGRV